MPRVIGNLVSIGKRELKRFHVGLIIYAAPVVSVDEKGGFDTVTLEKIRYLL